jgi:hypothetical protein
MNVIFHAVPPVFEILSFVTNAPYLHLVLVIFAVSKSVRENTFESRSTNLKAKSFDMGRRMLSTLAMADCEYPINFPNSV